MEKVSIVTNFQKPIDALKNTECSQKEKLFHFTQIAEYLQSPSVRGNVNYLQNFSSAVTIFLLFCEDLDSVTRMNAEENLYKIIRFSENSNIVRIQYDLYHEIKKNGNERSLRICLNLFGYYCHLIKQRKTKAYAANLLPCIYSISQRKETLLIETLSEFLKIFCKYLQICLNEKDIVKLIEVFLRDTIAECSIKRRCASQNILTLIENGHRKEMLAKIAFNKCLDIFIKQQGQNTIIGILGFLRVLLPIWLKMSNCDFNKIIEIYEICLNLLNDNSHTIINSSLEVMHVISNEPNIILKNIMTNSMCIHLDIICKRKSLNNLKFNCNINNNNNNNNNNNDENKQTSRKSSTATIRKSEENTAIGEDNLIVENIPEKNKNLFECKSLENIIDTDENKDDIDDGGGDDSNDKPKFQLTRNVNIESIDCEKNIEIGASSIHKIKKSDSISLKSQKSTESIGSFINSLLTHPNTDSVSKFFRPQKAGTSPNTPKHSRKNSSTFVNYINDFDNLSLQSVDSQLSINSNSSSFSALNILNKKQQEKLIDKDDNNRKSSSFDDKLNENENNEQNMNKDSTDNKTLINNDYANNNNQEADDVVQIDYESKEILNKIYIGTIYDQTLVHYTIRLIASQFLLNGQKYGLIPDNIVRVSIKSLSLLVIGNLIQFCPELLLLCLNKEQSVNINNLSNYNNNVVSDIQNNVVIDDELEKHGFENLFSSSSSEEEEEEEEVEEKDTLENAKSIIPIVNIDNINKNDNDNNIELEIKDDHFGKSLNKYNYFDFSSPLSKSADDVFLTKSTQSKLGVENNTNNNSDNNNFNNYNNIEIGDNKNLHKLSKKLNKHLNNTLSKSEIIESKRRYSDIIGLTTITPYQCTDVKQMNEIQFIQDIILYYNHNDPVLRANIQIIIGNFFLAVFRLHSNFNEFLRVYQYNENVLIFINFNLLLQILLQGLSDDIHTVVIQSLTSFSNIFSYLLRQENLTINKKIIANVQQRKSILKRNENLLFYLKNIESGDNIIINKITIQNIMDELLFVYENKYWVVQCKYCDLITKINCEHIKFIYNWDIGNLYETKFLNHIYSNIKDNDVRIRNNAAKSLCKYIENKLNNNLCKIENRYFILLQNFTYQKIFKELPKPLCYFNNARQLKVSNVHQTSSVNKVLAKILYDITNKLLELDDKNQQFGIINAISELIKQYNPIYYSKIWNEFNLIEICITYINQNYTTGTDLTCQCDLIVICTNLLAGNIESTTKQNKFVNILLEHLLKILNIYHHIFSNQKPIFLPKGLTKVDLFTTSSKDLNLISNYGYFGNDYFYLKIYNILKISYENYKISINNESGVKMMTLLKSCLHSLTVLLEIKTPDESSQSFKLIEVILQYLTTIINFAPKKCIICIKHLIKYLFCRTFMCRKKQYEYFIGHKFEVDDPDKIVDLFHFVREFTNYTEIPNGDKIVNFNTYIKLFESIVIQSLKIFTKSNAEVQSVVLDMLCQVMDYKVNYYLLDSNNVFIDFVLKLLELIETGTIRKSDVITPSIIKFLFYLSKQTEKKLITIPKIINITDTLLANNTIINCGTQALNELAYEFFFNQIPLNNSNITELNTKEINTQKEVAFSMLIKFINEIEIQEIISCILLFNKSKPIENEKELLNNILQFLQDKKIEIKTMKNFQILDVLFQTIGKNILMNSQHFEYLIKLLLDFIYMDDVNFNNLSISTIFLNNFIFCTEEVFLLKHIKLYLNKSDKWKEDDNLNESKFLANTLYKLIYDSLASLKSEFHMNLEFTELFINFLKCILKFPKFQITTGWFRREYFNENLFNLIINTDNNEIITIFIQFMLNIDCDKFIYFNKMNTMGCDLKFSTIKMEIFTMLCEKYPHIEQWNGDEINFVIENYIELLLLNAGGNFLINLVASEIYSIKLLNKLKVFILVKNNSEKIMDTIMKIMDNSNNVSSLHIIIDIILENILCLSNNKAIVDRAINLLQKKLNIIKNLSDTKNKHKILSELQYSNIVNICKRYNINESYPNIMLIIKDLSYYYNNQMVHKKNYDKIDFNNLENIELNECWFIEQVQYITYNCTIDKSKIVKLLNEIKSQDKLNSIFLSINFNNYLLSECIHFACRLMTNSFKNDCIQYHPHLNYLKMPPLLKISLNILYFNLEKLFNCDSPTTSSEGLPSSIITNFNFNELTQMFTDCDFIKNFKYIRNAIITLMEHLDNIENICLIYIESKFIDKFIKDNLLKQKYNELFIAFSTLCTMFVDHVLMVQNNNNTADGSDNDNDINFIEIDTTLKCIDLILTQKFIWIELNQSDKYINNIQIHLKFIYFILNNVLLTNTNFQNKYKNPLLPNNNDNTTIKASTSTAASSSSPNTAHLDKHVIELYRKAIFIAKFVEIENDTEINSLQLHNKIIKQTITSIAISILRTDSYYFFAIVPHEILINYNIDLTDPKLNRLPSIPIEYLNDVEIVEKFVKRINTFGFSTKQHFEEFFMSLLLLVNETTNEDVIDIQEQYHIKSICLSAIIELLISCKMYTRIGCRNGKFHHFPRTGKIKADSISIKKLHRIQLLISEPNIFYQSNLERIRSGPLMDNIIGSHHLSANQFEMNCIWQIIEEITDINNIPLANCRYFIQQSGIDLKSSVQLIYDVFSQMVEENVSLILPYLAKFCEICEDRDQFRRIKDTMLKLQETLHMENAVCHQYIIYCLCKAYAILVPSLSDLTHLCNIIHIYLKSSHIFVRNATLNGLLCILESCVKTNTTIGGLSEELLLIRNVIMNYVIKYGIIEESLAAFSNEHTKLVWTLNFYLIETTSKFVPDCNLLSNTIISANNILKRTINVDQYLCIVHGLERLVVTNVISKMFREKIEKISLDLVKLENEKFSIPALKLLISCMYIGSSEQLENTEHSNGIVQDEPEIIVQSTEKIDILFQRIKTATPKTAKIFGNVLCQITRDLVPPNEILTKVIKELLTLSQPHCEVIAKIVFQVFRSAIDSSYLLLLQDWLICSLANFLSIPIRKAVWCLSVIFISSSINLHLIKIFPEILAVKQYNNNNNNNNNLSDREILNFLLVSNDFYVKLDNDQKLRFREVFENDENEIFKIMLKNCNKLA